MSISACHHVIYATDRIVNSTVVTDRVSVVAQAVARNIVPVLISVARSVPVSVI